MSRVLVAYGSKHGATVDIAEAIGERLGARDVVAFGGRLPVESSGFIVRAMLRATPENQRDRRDFDAIAASGHGIAAELSSSADR